jgi:hypothetical protein
VVPVQIQAREEAAMGTLQAIEVYHPPRSRKADDFITELFCGIAEATRDEGTNLLPPLG